MLHGVIPQQGCIPRLWERHVCPHRLLKTAALQGEVTFGNGFQGSGVLLSGGGLARKMLDGVCASPWKDMT